MSLLLIIILGAVNQQSSWNRHDIPAQSFLCLPHDLTLTPSSQQQKLFFNVSWSLFLTQSHSLELTLESKERRVRDDEEESCCCTKRKKRLGWNEREWQSKKEKHRWRKRDTWCLSSSWSLLLLDPRKYCSLSCLLLITGCDSRHQRRMNPSSPPLFWREWESLRIKCICCCFDDPILSPS